MKQPLSRLAALALVAALAAPASAVTLYDPASGLPSAQGWTTASLGGGVDTLVAGPLLHIDTTAGDAIRHGHGNTSSVLDTATGFTLSFDLRVVSEAHSSGDRSGFSLLVQGQDQSKAIQLSFWSGTIWASDTLFLKAESISPSTAPTLLQTYTLQVVGNQYTLASDAAPGTLLTGAMRDYPYAPANSLTLVYNQANTISFTDNTTSARAAVELGLVTLTPVPEPASAFMLLAGLAGLGALAARRRRA